MQRLLEQAAVRCRSNSRDGQLQRGEPLQAAKATLTAPLS
jgi:hypothetical protein